MNNCFSFSDREEDVAGLLAEGRSNREIAHLLGISERTVEFHLTHIYEKLGVKSRAEAIIELREAAAVGNGGSGGNGDRQGPPATVDPPTPGTPVGPPARPPGDDSGLDRSWKNCLSFSIIAAILIAIIAILLTAIPIRWEGYTREGEKLDGSTVGQTLYRVNASKSQVHGQFGTTGAEPWPAQYGYAVYKGIQTPPVHELFLNVHYSKYSSATVPILVYLDDETTPRISMVPIDQHSWDAFTWTGTLSLGEVQCGEHTIKFVTDGQQYGVADLDEFELSAKEPYSLWDLLWCYIRGSRL